MSRRWPQSLLAVPLSVWFFTACAEPPSGPAAEAPLFARAGGKMLPTVACDFSQPPLMVGGLERCPSGQAQLGTNPSGQLVITNFGPSGQDGWCTVLPNWNGEQVTEPSPIQL